MPDVLQIPWEAIKLAAVAGVPYKSLAIQFGLMDSGGKPDTNAIRQRAFREQWPVPSRIRESARRHTRDSLQAAQAASSQAQAALRSTAAGQQGAASNGAHQQGSGVSGQSSEAMGGEVSGGVTAVTDGKKVSINGSLEAPPNVSAAVTIAAHLLANAEQSTVEASNRALSSLKAAPVTLPVTSASDLKSLMQVARIAAGMDKPETQVQVNLFGPASAVSSSASSFIELDAEPLEEQEESYNEADL